MRHFVFFLTLLGLLLPLQAAPPSDVVKISDSLAVLSAEPLFSYNTEAAQALLEDALKKNPRLRSLTLIDTLTGKKFVSVHRPSSNFEATQIIRRSLSYRGEIIGELRIRYSPTLVSLTEEEQRWIHQHPLLKVGMVDWEPIAIVKNTTLQGMAADYLHLISERTGLRFHTIPMHSWQEMRQKLQSHQIDLIPSADFESFAEDNSTLASHTYLEFPYVLVSRIKESFINSLEDLRTKSIAVPQGWPSDRFLRTHYPSIPLLPTHNIIDALEFVKNNRAYAFLGNMAVGMYYVGNYYSNSLHIAGKIDATLKLKMLTRKEMPLLISIINKALDSLSPQEHQQIRNRWLHIEVKEAADYTIFYLIGGVFLLLILASLYWNRKLSKEIQERTRIEKKLERAKQEAEQANQAKSIFLANMSHEIRTPMNAIVGFTELLSDEVEHPKLQSYVHNIQNASHTLLRLINDILDLSKIEAGKLELEYAPTDLRRLCQDILSVFELTAKKKGIALKQQIDDRLPAFMMLDEIRLRQILLNLLGNAVKFTESGSVTLKVDANPLPENPRYVQITLAIQDTGIGIPPDQIESIFGAFEQMQGQDSRKFGGTGLGLSISKRLCEMMGGTIHVESTPGEGSTFFVYLPRVEIAASLNQSASQITPTPQQFSKATLLIVDDVPDNRELLMKMFEQSPFTLISARDGVEAIERFERYFPDLVLMDLRMPRMDGYEAAQKIKEISPKTPIIALTASIMQVKADDPRFDGILGKPINRDALYRLIGRYLPFSPDLSGPTDDNDSTLDPENIHKLRLLLTPEQREGLYRSYRQALGSNDIHEIESFTEILHDLASRHTLPSLQKKAQELQDALEAFDISRLEELLRELRPLEQIREV